MLNLIVEISSFRYIYCTIKGLQERIKKNSSTTSKTYNYNSIKYNCLVYCRISAAYSFNCCTNPMLGLMTESELEPVSFFATGPTGRFDLFNRTGPADNRPVDICHITGKKPVKTFKLKYHFSSQNTISVVCMFSSLRNQRKCCPFQYASKCDKNDTSYYVVFSDFIVTATL